MTDVNMLINNEKEMPWTIFCHCS